MQPVRSVKDSTCVATGDFETDSLVRNLRFCNAYSGRNMGAYGALLGPLLSGNSRPAGCSGNQLLPPDAKSHLSRRITVPYGSLCAYLGMPPFSVEICDSVARLCRTIGQ